jgi:hypothetical protein
MGGVGPTERRNAIRFLPFALSEVNQTEIGVTNERGGIRSAIPPYELPFPKDRVAEKGVGAAGHHGPLTNFVLSGMLKPKVPNVRPFDENYDRSRPNAWPPMHSRLAHYGRGYSEYAVGWTIAGGNPWGLSISRKRRYRCGPGVCCSSGRPSHHRGGIGFALSD